MDLKRKVKQALDEVRILSLGDEVLLGFEFRGALERGFDELPPRWQDLKLVGLVLLLVTTALLMSPASYHPSWTTATTRGACIDSRRQ